MNPLVIFFMVMAFVGLADKLIGNKAGLGKAFDNGLSIMGDLILYLLGVYVVCITISEAYHGEIAAATAGWFFDPSVLAGSIITLDMGGYPICKAIAHSDAMGTFSGICLAGTLGTLVTFFLPTFLSKAEGEQRDNLVLGFLYGIVVIPVTAFIGGLILRIPVTELLKNLLPVIILCALLFVGLVKVKEAAIVILKVIGNCFKAVTFISFGIVVFSMIVPSKSLVDMELASNTVVMIFKLSMNVIGALVAMELLQKILKKPISKLAGILGTNDVSVSALIIGMPGGIAMLPLLPEMDRKGVILNGAFAVSAFYTFGGQMALIAANEPISGLLLFFFSKFIGGVLAVLLACIMEK